jgi:ADP-heptose:LPS heptosyltransferase
MSTRRRWVPVVGTRSRIYEAHERVLVAAAEWPLHALAALGHVTGLLPARAPEPLDLASVREVLVLRLDRIGDVVMCWPALEALRRLLPSARIRLAVGRWSRTLATGAPVDELLEWSAPWVGRASEGADTFGALLARARGLRSARLDLALDLQGDVRANLLLAASGARRRVGYANTGGAALLTHVVPLDERVAWVEQNLRAVEVALGHPLVDREAFPVPSLLSAAERAAAAALLHARGFLERRPLVGLHPSGGRRIKQWDPARWAQVLARLEREHGARFVITGSAADRGLVAAVSAGLTQPHLDLTGLLDVRQTLAVIAQLDLFLSPDTGPMHMACAVDTPSVSIFGPSDAVRYFSGGSGALGTRHIVVRAELWCSPCNLIRKPPRACDVPAMPECLRAVEVEAVYAAAASCLPRR